MDTGGNVLTIRNNAFVDNLETLTPAPVTSSAISNNGFFNNTSVTTFGANPVTAAPLFVDPDARDFHLQAGSPYIDAGTGFNDILDDTVADIGAYGGERAEGIPVASLHATGAGRGIYARAGFALDPDLPELRLSL